MAYCRWDDDSDVYAYMHVDGYFHVMLPAFDETGRPFRPDLPDREYFLKTPADVIGVLHTLKAKGLAVPDYAFDRLKDTRP